MSDKSPWVCSLGTPRKSFHSYFMMQEENLPKYHAYKTIPHFDRDMHETVALESNPSQNAMAGGLVDLPMLKLILFLCKCLRCPMN